MASENYVFIAQFFYIIQNMARVYFFTSALAFKKDDIKHKAFLTLCISILNLSLSCIIFDNFVLKVGVDVIFTTILFKIMSIEKLSKILVYIMLVLNLEMIYELTITFSVIVVIGPDVFHSDSSIFNIFLQIYLTFVFCIFMVVAANMVKKKSFQISLKLAVLIVGLTILQSSLMLSILYGMYTRVTTERLVLPFVGIFFSYILLKVTMKRIYMEYKYKKNIAYFLAQYQESLENYMELKEHDEEISYLRHEILNQLEALEACSMVHYD